MSEHTRADDLPAEPVAIPHGELEPATLRRVIESFVLREGTEYGEHDVPLETKVGQVRVQLERREATIYFDPVTESVQILPTRPEDRGRRSRSE